MAGDRVKVIAENVQTISASVEPTVQPTDYTKNLSWRRWPIMIIFMIYGIRGAHI